MISKIYVIYSKESSVYASPFIERNDEAAILFTARVCIDQIGHDSFVQLHPENYDLYCLGTFDHDSGLLHNEQPTFVRNLKRIVDALVEQFEGESDDEGDGDDV